MSATIYQVSDLAHRRTEFIDDARQGVARLRDKDGTSLVMLPESRLDFLERVRGHIALFLIVEHAARTNQHADVISLGQHAWLRSLPIDDFAEFASELGEALAVASSDGTTDVLEDIVDAWRITARQLEDPLRRRILLSTGFDPSDYEEAAAPRPADDADAPNG